MVRMSLGRLSLVVACDNLEEILTAVLVDHCIGQL